LVGELLCYELKLGIPILSKAADKGLFEELVDGKVFLLSFEYGHLAHIPTVVVEGAVGTIFTHTNRVEVTRYRLVERYSTLTIGTLDGAVAASTLVVAGEHAVFAIDDGGDKFAAGVVIRDALTLDDFACFR
jgi:hypothetical protein